MVNQSPSDTHDSSTCPHPDDCYWCKLERESERKERQRALKTLAEAGVFNAHKAEHLDYDANESTCTCPLHRLSPADRTALIDRAVEATNAEVKREGAWGLSVGTMRAALFDTFDENVLGLMRFTTISTNLYRFSSARARLEHE